MSDFDGSVGSHKKASWDCSCGRTASAVVRYVARGRIRTCGRCNEVSAEEMRFRLFGRLRMSIPKAVLPGSHEKVSWDCSCGRKTESLVMDVFKGKTTSCQRCDEVPAEEMRTRKFGKLRMAEPAAVMPGSGKKVDWSCDCGKTKSIVIASVFTGLTTSCAECERVPAAEMAVRKFGRLRLKTPVDFALQSNKKHEWLCNCGNETNAFAYSVTTGGTKSCGRCYRVAREWWMVNRKAIRDLKCPILPSDVPAPFKALETIVTKKSPFRAVCISCGREYSPRWGNIRRGTSITCGCSYNRISSLSLRVKEIVDSFGLACELEHKVEGLSYDVFVPSANLLLELGGLKWHSNPRSKQEDSRKRDVAIAAGHRFVMLFEDEVRSPFLAGFLKNLLGGSRPVSLRPSQCEIALVLGSEASAFYDANHYIGACRAVAHYGASFEGKLIVCASFSNPTRQSSHPWELVRMASSPDYRVHGVWGKIMKVFLRGHSPLSVVSFSDNRLFQGGVYEKIGFRRDGLLGPDYYWTDGYRRFHKSGLRKRGTERTSGLTEAQLREAQGLRKIWDLGKTRWVWEPFDSST